MQPYCSIIISARNDNHGVNFAARLRTFLRSLDRQAASFPGVFELVIVEWNPPPDRPPLATTLPAMKALATRIVTVPPERHLESPLGPTTMPVSEWCKNVGIRRARGEFVMTTNPDIVMSDALIALIGNRKLSASSFYRLDRYDFDGSAIEAVPADGMLAHIRQRTAKVYVRHDGRELVVPDVAGDDPACWPSSRPFKYDELDDGGAMIVCHDRNSYVWGLHTQGCGDFVLAHRDAWLQARGFPERGDTYLHIDSFLLCRLSSLGLCQVILRNPYLLFHFDHSRAAYTTRPVLPWPDTYYVMNRLVQYGRPSFYNAAQWGIGDHALEEHVLS